MLKKICCLLFIVSFICGWKADSYHELWWSLAVNSYLLDFNLWKSYVMKSGMLFYRVLVSFFVWNFFKKWDHLVCLEDLVLIFCPKHGNLCSRPTFHSYHLQNGGGGWVLIFSNLISVSTSVYQSCSCWRSVFQLLCYNNCLSSKKILHPLFLLWFQLIIVFVLIILSFWWDTFETYFTCFNFSNALPCMFDPGLSWFGVRWSFREFNKSIVLPNNFWGR